MAQTKQQPAPKTIDVTPSWEGVLPVMLVVLSDGDAAGRKIVKEELRRMAQIADKYVAIEPKLKAAGLIK